LKIFNITPIQVTEFIYDPKQNVTANSTDFYESNFSYSYNVVDSLNTLTIYFELEYLIGDNSREIVAPMDNPNKWNVEISFGTGEGDNFLAYKCVCRFNFERTSLDADIISINEFLNGYYAHVLNFISQDGFEAVSDKEREVRANQPLIDIARNIVDTLTG